MVDQQAPAPTVEQWVSFGNYNSNNEQVAQLFTVGLTGKLKEIRAAASCPDGAPVVLQILNAADPIQSSSSTGGALQTYQDERQRKQHPDRLNAFILPGSRLVTAGDELALVFSSPTATQPCKALLAAGDAYPAGTLMSSNAQNTTFSAGPGDLAFRTLVER